jgi:hypothetical protein
MVSHAKARRPSTSEPARHASPSTDSKQPTGPVARRRFVVSLNPDPLCVADRRSCGGSGDCQSIGTVRTMARTLDMRCAVNDGPGQPTASAPRQGRAPGRPISPSPRRPNRRRGHRVALASAQHWVGPLATAKRTGASNERSLSIRGGAEGPQRFAARSQFSDRPGRVDYITRRGTSSGAAIATPPTRSRRPSTVALARMAWPSAHQDPDRSLRVPRQARCAGRRAHVLAEEGVQTSSPSRARRPLGRHEIWRFDTPSPPPGGHAVQTKGEIAAPLPDGRALALPQVCVRQRVGPSLARSVP